jgi:hypothetical protein
LNFPSYIISPDETFLVYQFKSVGPNGQITKGVQFTKVNDAPLVYNLALGDIDPYTHVLNDRVITDNKDRDKIFATVAFVALDFCRHHIGASVLVNGNTKAKKRLYQIQISLYLSEIEKHFVVYGLIEKDKKWEIFIKNKTYEALLVKPI